MRDICTGIYSKDRRYGKRLMEYLNHQKEYPMTAWFTSDEKKFFEKEREERFQCLVLSEETSYHGTVPACYIPSNGSKSASEVARNIYSCLNVPETSAVRIAGVYSLFGGDAKSGYAIAYARTRGMLYWRMRAHQSMEEGEEDTDELLFYIRERGDEAVRFFQSHQHQAEGVSGFFGAGCYLNNREPDLEHYRIFFDNLRKEGISLVVDMEPGSLPELAFFTLFDKVYLPIPSGSLNSDIYKNFIRQMKRYGIWEKCVMEEVAE